MILKRSQMYGLTQRTAVKMIVARDTTFNWLFFSKSQLCVGKTAVRPVRVSWWGLGVLDRILWRSKSRWGSKRSRAIEGEKKKKHFRANSFHTAIQAGNYQTNQPWAFQSQPFFCKQQQAERQTLSACHLWEKEIKELHISRANATSDLAPHPSTHLEVESNKWVAE